MTQPTSQTKRLFIYPNIHTHFYNYQPRRRFSFLPSSDTFIIENRREKYVYLPKGHVSIRFVFPLSLKKNNPHYQNSLSGIKHLYSLMRKRRPHEIKSLLGTRCSRLDPRAGMLELGSVELPFSLSRNTKVLLEPQDPIQDT